MMIAVVQDSDGTGFQFNQSALNGLEIAGKTGTARERREQPSRTRFSPLSRPLTTQRSPSAS